eukprot:TRINITY_DN16746_c0_g1_i2.p5 TRINITY_DN16746_c0_g1~~TRINITY_DN16746_c0_g1_i2.p5  ORF type:complete len:125 (-),score=8.08 TRINITY_DN16746_c0_g1_i2:2486-2860(-)
MNMSSTRLDTLIDEFPEESAAIARLSDLMAHSDDRSEVREYTSARMYDLLQPSNHRVLIQLLSSAAEKGLVKKIVRVMTAKGGIGDFDSLLDIPPTLFDDRIGIEVEVTPDNIALIYQVKATAH